MIAPRYRLIYKIFSALLIFSGFMDIVVVRFLVPSWTLGSISFIFGVFILYMCRESKRVVGNVKA